MRQAVTLLHRWFGLGAALFLFIAGITGAVISWDHELDDWLNPHLHESRAEGPALDALTAAALVEARDPRIRVAYLPLAAEPGETLSLVVLPKLDQTTGRLFEPGYNQLFLDPVTGEEVGRRLWGQVWPITSETLISFLYKLHYSLHFPEIGGIDRWGMWLLGINWRKDVAVALGAGVEDQNLRRRLSHQLRHSPRFWPVDVGAAVNSGFHLVFAQSLS